MHYRENDALPKGNVAIRYSYFTTKFYLFYEHNIEHTIITFADINEAIRKTVLGTLASVVRRFVERRFFKTEPDEQI